MKKIALTSLIVFISIFFGLSQEYLPNTLYVKVEYSYNEYFKGKLKSLPPLPLKIEKITPFFNTSIQEKLKKSGTNYTTHPIQRIYKVIYSDEILPEIAAEILKESDMIKDASPAPICQVFYQPDDPLADSLLPATNGQNQLVTHNFYKAWQVEKGDTNVVIGSVDTGILPSHEDIIDNIKRNPNDPINGKNDDGDFYFNDSITDNYEGWDIADFDNNPTLGPGSQHGHWVASISSATANNGKGLAGTGLNCKFLPIKAALDASSESISHGYDGLFYAAQHDCSVINLSWGSIFYPGDIILDLINFVTEELDVVMVGAAGNSGKDEYWYPASFENVLSVTAVNSDSSKWFASTYNYGIDISAAGSSIQMANVSNDSSYRTQSGTSMAAPIVSGAAALVRSKYPTWTAKQVMQQLKVTGYTLEQMPANSEFANKLGTLLDPYRALTDTNLPGLRTVRFTLLDHQDGFISGQGDTINIQLSITNYLANTDSSVMLFIDQLNDQFIHTDSIFFGLDINTFDTITTPTIEIIIPPTDSSFVPIEFLIHYSNDLISYRDKQYLGFGFTKSVIAGIQDSTIIEENEIDLFPNPVDKEITIKSTKTFNDLVYKIIDDKGHKLMEGKLKDDVKEDRINIEGGLTKSGQYILVIEGDQFLISKPFIKI